MKRSFIAISVATIIGLSACATKVSSSTSMNSPISTSVTSEQEFLSNLENASTSQILQKLKESDGGYARRVAFIRQALDGVQHCIADGIPVKGYFYWSLMDNFEWQKGYAMQFGLIAVNRETMERTAKPSLGVLGSYAEK